jgi:hypothetical protein
MNLKLGVKAKDKITGLQGIVTGKGEYLYGCTQYCIVPESKDGKPSEGCWFDEGRLEVVGRGILPEEVRAPKNGGPQLDAPRVR